MKILHNIGVTSVPQARGNYNTVEQIKRCKEPLSFDGIYENVYEHREILRGRNCLLFVVGDLMGKDNSFDTGMPKENYCSLAKITSLLGDGHTLGWHTWTHPDLTKISLKEAKKEMKCPWDGVVDFAYPYGNFNEDLMEIARELGYKRAWSTTQGNSNVFSLKRTYL